MDKILYVIFWLLSLLPLRLLYGLSDILYFLIYYVARYRRKIVSKNLSNSFPEKKKKELRKIEKKFYQYFCDTFIETVKLLSISDKEMSKRFTFDNIEILDEYYEKGKNIILYLGHYGNWEWLTFARRASKLKHKNEQECISVYHKLENKTFDKFYLRLRKKSNSILVPQEGLLRKLISFNKTGKLGMYCFIADQGTLWKNIYFWMDFLNQETAPIVGPEKIAKQTGFPVLYIDVQRRSRGYYHAHFVVMTENPKELPDFELTKQYMRFMEQTIKREPAYWLWTHNRWKRKKSQMSGVNIDRYEKISNKEFSLVDSSSRHN